MSADAPLAPGDRVAVLGLGKMGVPMANALAKSGFSVVGWTRSGRRDPALSPTVAMAIGPSDAIWGARAVVLSLFDDRAAEAVLFASGCADGLDPGTLVIDTGTTGPEMARDHAARLALLGCAYLDAPVSGGVVGAISANLSIFVGGEEDTFQHAGAVLRAMGRPHLLGPVGAGQSAKLANQIIAAVTIAAVAEGTAFAEAQGLDIPAFLAALQGGFADSTILRLHGPRMAARDFSAGGALRLHLKDLRLAGCAAPAVMAGLNHATQAEKDFDLLARNGRGSWDHSAYVLAYDPDFDDERGPE